MVSSTSVDPGAAVNSNDGVPSSLRVISGGKDKLWNNSPARCTARSTAGVSPVYSAAANWLAKRSFFVVRNGNGRTATPVRHSSSGTCLQSG